MRLTDAILEWVNPLTRIARALESISAALNRAYPARIEPPETPTAVVLSPSDGDYARWDDQEQQRVSEGTARRD